ncbi:MAG: MotA/TolQ/ExbB proton channel family protein [candidate division KSB1 bacterium]|nr:MotA/TolQ/ExbB proton channel family protein [candidate division KSB1 bacterium]
MTPLSAKGLQGLIPLLAGLGTVVQVLVLLALALASILCWAIVVHKVRLFRRVRRDNANFLQVFRTSHDLAFIAAAARRFTFSPLARLFRVAQQYLETPTSGNGRRGVLDTDMLALSSTTLERLRQALRPRQAEELDRLEQGLPLLATTASMAPFVGLFGTVWGIMQSFHAIGQGSGATLAVVGPGIADALIATAVGLAAAIPAGVAYNHFLNRLRRIDGEMDSFAEDVVQLFEAYAAHEVPAPRGGHRTPLSR